MTDNSTPEKFKLPLRENSGVIDRCVPHVFHFAEYCLVTAAVYFAALKLGLLFVWVFSLVLYFFLCVHAMQVMARVVKMLAFRKRWQRNLAYWIMLALVLSFVAATVIVAGAIGRAQGDVSNLPWLQSG